MVCVNTLDNNNQGWNRFRHDPYNRPMNMDEVDMEACSRHITYGGYELDPVYLVFRHKIKDLDTSKPVPITYDYGGQGIVNVIYSLDLSDNNYDYTPVLKSMQNLALLDLSKNQLTTAVLSNLYALNSLKEIDLSYNTISEIQVNTFDHPYSSLNKINLSHNYLVKIPDAVFDRFGYLETLDLSHNYIEGLSPFSFEGIKSLLRLNMSNNRLSDINSSLFRFSELKVLSLSNNRIKNLKLVDFEKLNKLEVLDLSSNAIQTFEFNLFQNMLQLYSLDLRNNVLDVLNKDTFTNLQYLSSIDLSRNKFKSLPKGLFKNKTVNTFSITDNLLEGSLSRGMFDGVNVTRLDLSNQFLSAIEDYAFCDLVRLDTLLLNNNGISSISSNSFKTIRNLEQLDLSSNQIVSIDFQKDDLSNLRSLLLRNNRLAQIKHEHFLDLSNLEYLDLSENAITQLAPSSFKSLRNLINLRISSNPLSGTLETDTFDGLVSLPTLDISCNLLEIIQNASFNDMAELKELNMSRSEIKELQYNVFVHTGYIETLDLSYNKLETFSVNMSELVGLSTLFLNNNLIKTILPSSLYGLSRLGRISLANNLIENLNNDTFDNLVDLRNVDLSNNEKLNFYVGLFERTKNLETINLSGVQTDIDFADISDAPILEVMMSDSGLHNISLLNLRGLTHLSTLILSNNSVSELLAADFSGLGTLRHLDLSHNKISFIQPGTFKDNSLLLTLNISHNSLSAIGYGIFRGLIYLDILDLSYNNIQDLLSERFYEVKSLSQLIVDHNRIDSVNAEEFAGTSLVKLSIGDNPLPCHILVKLKKYGTPFKITAIKLDEHNGENIDGVTCNKDYDSAQTKGPETVDNRNDILIDIRNILYMMNNNTKTVRESNDNNYLQNFTKELEKINTSNNEKFSNLANFSMKVVNINNDTNMILQKILNSLNENTAVTTTTVFTPIHNENKTIDFIPYVNKVKEELEKTIADEKQGVIDEIEKRLSMYHYQTESLPTSPNNEKLVSHDVNVNTKSFFTETCVALILLILVGLVLYKFYKSRMYIRNRLSFSTRELPGAMENSAL